MHRATIALITARMRMTSARNVRSPVVEYGKPRAFFSALGLPHQTRFVMPEQNPTITVGRSMVIDGRTYTAQQVVYPDTAPYYEILCPDGLSIDDADPYDHAPTDADFHEIAGIY